MDAIDYVELGKRIKRIREEQKITQEHLAEVVNLSPTHISNIETAHTRVSLSSLVLIANELKVSMDELLFDSLVYAYKDSALGNIVDLNDCSREEITIISDVVKALRTSLKKKKVNRK